MQYRLRIVRDDDAQNPRDNECPSTILSWSSYVAGDEQANSEGYDSPDALRQALIPTDAYLVRPVFAYVHGGVALSLGPYSCQFDSGQVGWIYITKEKATEYFGTDFPPSKIEACFKAELAEYEAWMGGNAWGFVLEKATTCATCSHVTYEEEDSCWGFLGESAKDAIGEHLPDEVRPLFEKAWDDRT